MHYVYKPHGVCSRLIEIDTDEEGRLSRVAFQGGCNGNLKGIGALIRGWKPEKVIERLRGIRCGMKNTSCPDQLSKALEAMLEEQK